MRKKGSNPPPPPREFRPPPPPSPPSISCDKCEELRKNQLHWKCPECGNGCSCYTKVENKQPRLMKWYSPEEFLKFWLVPDRKTQVDIIVLVKDKDDAYLTEHIFNVLGGMNFYLNVPLHTFSFKEFKPSNYQKIAIVDMQMAKV